MSRITSAPSTARLFSDSLDEVLVAVGDRDLGAELGAQVQLVLRPGRDRNPAAERTGHLDRVRADPARAAVDEDQPACRQVRRHDQVRPHRARDFGQCGGIVQRHGVRDRHHLTGGHGDVLGIASARQQTANLLLDGPPGDAVAEPGDRPRHLQSEGLAGARRRRVLAGGLQ